MDLWLWRYSMLNVGGASAPRPLRCGTKPREGSALLELHSHIPLAVGALRPLPHSGNCSGKGFMVPTRPIPSQGAHCSRMRILASVSCAGADDSFDAGWGSLSVTCSNFARIPGVMKRVSWAKLWRSPMVCFVW